MAQRPESKHSVPETLDWDLWLGPAPYRDYSPDYVPFNWRGWWDFGSGGLGDMGIHNLAEGDLIRIDYSEQGLDMSSKSFKHFNNFLDQVQSR